MTRVKGSTLVPRLNYLKAHDPGDGLNRLLSGLTPDCAAAVRAGLMTHEWYPLDFYVQLNRGIDRVLGNGDLKVVWTLGRHSAEEALQGIYKVFLKVGSPEFVIKAASTIWKQYYDTGVMTLVKDPAAGGRKLFRLTVQGFQQNDESIWLAIGGWIERTLELSGGRKVKVEPVTKGLRPGVNFEFLCSWE
jgi:hypothetical protein